MVVEIVVISFVVIFFIVAFLLSLFKGIKIDDEEYSLGQEDKIIIIEDVDNCGNQEEVSIVNENL